MKSFLFVLFVLSQSVVFCQPSSTSVFHRAVITNDQDQLLLVRIKSNGFWVTPGIYQSPSESMRVSLEGVAAEYGLKASAPELRGVFTLERTINDSTWLSLRNVFVLRAENEPSKSPAYIDEYRWVTPEEAVQLLTFPHISEMIKAVFENRDVVWGGTLTQHQEDGKWSTSTMEVFYPLFEKR